MARTPTSFTNLFVRQNTCNIRKPHHHIRNIAAGGDDREIIPQKDNINSNNHKQQNLSEIAKEVSEIIRTRPRWEQTLLSDFPTINFFDPKLLHEVLEQQTNVLWSLRFFYWLSSRDGFLANHASCNLIFGRLLETNAAIAAKDFIQFTKFSPEPDCLELYIQCLCANGEIEEALNTFDQLKSIGTVPSLPTWNSTFLALIQARRTDVVLKLYGEMVECGVVADVDTVGYLISTFCIDNKVSEGYDLLQHVLKSGNVPNNVVFNKLISGSVKDWNYTRVSALLHTMIAHNRAPDIYTYQEIISGKCKRSMRRERFWIFNDLKDRGYAPDRVMYTTMIHGLCKMKWLGDARKLWFEMIQKGIIPNEYTYSALIYGLCKIGNLEEAEKLYKEMCDGGYKESTLSCNTMINGLCSHGRTEEALDLLKKMPEKGIAHDVLTYNFLIQGFCKEGKIMESTDLLNELLKQGLQPSTASYTPLIEKLCEVGRMQEAKALWSDMREKGVEPASCTHDFIIMGLSKEGFVEEGIERLATMLSSRLIPQKETFERLNQSLCQKDKLADALLVLDYMFRIGRYALNECIYYSLVNKLCQGNSHHVEICLVDILK